MEKSKGEKIKKELNLIRHQVKHGTLTGFEMKISIIKLKIYIRELEEALNNFS